MQLVENPADAQTLAQAIVNTIAEPFLVLDAQLRVLAASRSFYDTFKVDPDNTQGKLLYALGDGQWDIPALRELLETIIPQKTAMEGFEVELDLPNVGRRDMLLNARKVVYENSGAATILLAFHDDTTRRAIERVKEALQTSTTEMVQQKQTLIDEMQHRVANSLQIIASILMLKARAVTSEEARIHLKDAHQRVMSIASVQQHLHMVDGVEQIEVKAYLETLCKSLVTSMASESQPVALTVKADAGRIRSNDAVSIGLIVTELMINAFKYAYPVFRADAAMSVSYEIQGDDWKLVVADNGSGKGDAVVSKGTGLGTAIVQALVRQLEATVDTVSGPDGLSVSVTRATFTPRTATAEV